MVNKVIYVCLIFENFSGDYIELHVSKYSMFCLFFLRNNDGSSFGVLYV